jgi:hypothetical protein
MAGIAPCQHQEACYDKPLIGTISMFDFPGSRERLWLRRRIAIQKLRESVEQYGDTIYLREKINEKCRQR